MKSGVAIHVLMEHAFVHVGKFSNAEGEVAIHVLMEHAFVRNPYSVFLWGRCWSQSTCSWNTRLYGVPRGVGDGRLSQSTCSWNTRLYSRTRVNLEFGSRNPRAHGTRVCTELRRAQRLRRVAIHVLMEHAFVRNRPPLIGD